MKIVDATWCPMCQTFHNFALASAGIDGQWGTLDDLTYPDPSQRVAVACPRAPRFQGFVGGRGGFGGMGGGMGGFAGGRGGFAEAGAKAEAAKPTPAAPVPPPAAAVNAPDRGPPAAAEPVRIRQYFPETLYFNPAVITDADGNALLRVPLADSITTWRLTCMASSARGRLGSATAGINVFQDFFVDIDFPVALTQHDEVSVPVAVYNYLKTDQAVRLEVTPGDWFDSARSRCRR